MQTRYSRLFKGLDFLLFPELVDGGYAALARGAAPHHAGDTFVDCFKTASKRFSLCCVAGSMHFADDPSVCTNTSLAFYRGRLIHRYDKIHLFKPAAEHQYFHRGNSIRAFTVGHGALRLKAGVVICYDLRFPELIRNLALQEMKLLIVPARWPRSRDDAWYALLKARAIENQIFVVGCNAIGKEGGYSYAFDPLGMLVFSNRKKQNRLFNTFTVDIERVRTAKRLHNNLRDAVLLRKASSSLPP